MKFIWFKQKYKQYQFNYKNHGIPIDYSVLWATSMSIGYELIVLIKSL